MATDRTAVLSDMEPWRIERAIRTGAQCCGETAVRAIILDIAAGIVQGERGVVATPCASH